MPKATSQQQAEKELAKEMKALAKEIQKIKDMEFVQILKHPIKLLWFSFLKGLMVGFGSVLGASVLVGAFLYLLAQISFLPLVGGFVQDISSYINVAQPSETQPQEDPLSEELNENK